MHLPPDPDWNEDLYDYLLVTQEGFVEMAGALETILNDPFYSPAGLTVGLGTRFKQHAVGMLHRAEDVVLEHLVVNFPINPMERAGIAGVGTHSDSAVHAGQANATLTQNGSAIAASHLDSGGQAQSERPQLRGLHISYANGSSDVQMEPSANHDSPPGSPGRGVQFSFITPIPNAHREPS